MQTDILTEGPTDRQPGTFIHAHTYIHARTAQIYIYIYVNETLPQTQAP